MAVADGTRPHLKSGHLAKSDKSPLSRDFPDQLGFLVWCLLAHNAGFLRTKEARTELTDFIAWLVRRGSDIRSAMKDLWYTRNPHFCSTLSFPRGCTRCQ